MRKLAVLLVVLTVGCAGSALEPHEIVTTDLWCYRSLADMDCYAVSDPARRLVVLEIVDVKQGFLRAE